MHKLALIIGNIEAIRVILILAVVTRHKLGKTFCRFYRLNLGQNRKAIANIDRVRSIFDNH